MISTRYVQGSGSRACTAILEFRMRLKLTEGIGRPCILVPGASELTRYATFGVWFESVAQLVEHRPFKALVLGSSPSALTIKPS